MKEEVREERRDLEEERARRKIWDVRQTEVRSTDIIQQEI